MRCEICDANPATDSTVSLFRKNEFGVTGIWRCKNHLDEQQIVEDDVKDLVETLLNK